MTTLHRLIFTFTLLPLIACTTREEIKRKEEYQSLKEELGQGQAASGEALFKINSMVDEINLLRGKQEKQEQLQDQTAEQFSAIQERIEKLEAAQADILNHLKSIQNYLQTKVTKKETAPSKPAKSSFSFSSAVDVYQKGQIKSAIKQIEKVLAENNQLKAQEKAQLLHHLGDSYVRQSQFEQALTPLSTLYSEFPKSRFIPSGLFMMGKSFVSLNKIKEAKGAFLELTKKYPETKEAKLASELLAKMEQ